MSSWEILIVRTQRLLEHVLGGESLSDISGVGFNPHPQHMNRSFLLNDFFEVVIDS